MRNILLAIIAGPLLLGCLTKVEPITPLQPGGATVGNSAPQISGDPPDAIRFGEMYEFEPNAVDADGDPLTFEVTNSPAWSSFDASTGKISGQPTLADIGVYEDIVISASDGASDSALRPFSITVTQDALGNVTLSWVAPTENSDGTALVDLAGYKIYYRKNSNNSYKEIRIDNAGISTYVVDNLSPATYYFAATAFNTSGMESSFSSEVQKVVN
jgi:hypothetical protein